MDGWMDDCLHHGIGYSHYGAFLVAYQWASLKLEPAVPYGKEKSAEADD